MRARASIFAIFLRRNCSMIFRACRSRITSFCAIACTRRWRARRRTSPTGLHIKEVIVSGDLAVVRLTWISTVTAADGASETDDEQGLDVFAKQADGSWKIIRYIAYPELSE